MLPAVNPPACLGERPAQRASSCGRGRRTRDDQRRRAVGRPQRPASSRTPRHMRGSSHAASPSRSRSDGGRSSPSHAQRNSRPISSCSALGSRTRPSAVWWFSSSGTRMRGLASAVLLSVCANRTFPSRAAVADVRPPRLPVVQRRAAVRLAIFAEARHPALDVVHAIFAEAHVAGRGLDHLVGDFERLRAALRRARAAARATRPTARRRPRRSHIARPSRTGGRAAARARPCPRFPPRGGSRARSRRRGSAACRPR